MEEEANLGEHAKHVCSCLDVVAALARQGQLTQAEEQRARSYLKLREKPWPSPMTIEPGAVLYLDGLSVNYLQHLRLLRKIHAAGFSGIVPPGEVLQGDGFVRYEDLTSRATGIIDDIRQKLAEGLSTGKVVLASSSKNKSDKAGPLQGHRSRCEREPLTGLGPRYACPAVHHRCSLQLPNPSPWSPREFLSSRWSRPHQWHHQSQQSLSVVDRGQ
jgi:hypothetical protein